MKILEITVDPKGRARVETKGFTGGECRDASRTLEQALGQSTGETLTAAFYQEQATPAGPAPVAVTCVPPFRAAHPDHPNPKEVLMTLGERLAELVRAAFSGLYVHSFEHDDAIAEIAGLCRREGWALATWDVDRGLAVAGESAEPRPPPAPPTRWRRSGRWRPWPRPTAPRCWSCRNFHRYLNSIEVVQALDTAIAAGKQARTFVVILAPTVQIPVELERQFLVVAHDLPGRDQLEAIARAVAVEPGEFPDGDARTAVLDAAAGLTRVEAENAMALSLVRHGRLDPGVMWELKAQALKKSGLLTLHRGGETFAELGGLETLKRFCTRALRPTAQPACPAPRRAAPGGARARANPPFARPSGKRPAAPR